MKPVMQTITTIPGGDCFRACIASILELAIDEVPNFCATNDKPPFGWVTHLFEWLRGQNLSFAIHEFHGKLLCPIEGYCILGVAIEPLANPQRPEWLHAVVGLASVRADGAIQFDVIHDPNPRPRSIAEIKDVLWIVSNEANRIVNQ